MANFMSAHKKDQENKKKKKNTVKYIMDFFGLLKTEIFYGKEGNYKTIDDLY